MPTVREIASRKSAQAMRAQAARRRLVRAHRARQETRRANARAGIECEAESRAPVITAWFEGARATALCVSSSGPYVREVEVSVGLREPWESSGYEALRAAMTKAVVGVMFVAGIQDGSRVKSVVEQAFSVKGR